MNKVEKVKDRSERRGREGDREEENKSQGKWRGEIRKIQGEEGCGATGNGVGARDPGMGGKNGSGSRRNSSYNQLTFKSKEE